MKMGKEISTIGNIEIEKNTFYCYKSPIFLNDLDIDKVLVSNKISFGEKSYKYFIGYFYNDHKVKPLYIMLPKTSAYFKSYDGKPQWMYFLDNDDEFLKKHNTIRDKFSADIKK